MPKLLSLSDAIETVTGRRPNLSTSWRWTTRGCSGVRLQTICVGGKRLTTCEMVEDFIQATTAAKHAPYEKLPVAPSKVREKQVAKASADLRNKCSKRTKAKA